MAKTNKIKSKKWEIAVPYRESLGLKSELISVELIGGKTIRTFQEYNVWSCGTYYKNGDKSERVEERIEKFFVRQYAE